MVAHWRVPIEVMQAGSAMRLFQASQAAVTIASHPSKTQLDSWIHRRNCQTFSTGFSSGDFGGSGSTERFSGKCSFPVVCRPAWSSKRIACGCVGFLKSGRFTMRGFDREVEMKNHFAGSKLIIKSDRGDIAVVGLNIDDPDTAFCGNRS